MNIYEAEKNRKLRYTANDIAEVLDRMLEPKSED